MPTQSVVVTAHNKAHYLERFISELRRVTPNAELVGIDDGSTDDTGHILETQCDAFAKTPDVWETRANNAGMRLASGDFVAIVQDDELVTERSWLDRSISQMSKHDVGILGGRGVGHIYYGFGVADSNGDTSDPDGALGPETQRLVLLSRGGVVRMRSVPFWTPSLTRLDIHLARARPRSTKRIVEVDVTIRSPFIIRRDVINSIGLLDEAYAPLGFDDHAYCMRARQNGFRVCTRVIAQRSRFGGGSAWLYNEGEKSAFLRASMTKNKRLFVSQFGTTVRKSRPLVLREYR
jgi:GT2 family glycosyltransferase